jgi:hypothetical protein
MSSVPFKKIKVGQLVKEFTIFFDGLIIKIVDIIDHPDCYLKQDISETGFSLHLQVEPTQVCPIERAKLYL